VFAEFITCNFRHVDRDLGRSHRTRSKQDNHRKPIEILVNIGETPCLQVMSPRANEQTTSPLRRFSREMSRGTLPRAPKSQDRRLAATKPTPDSALTRLTTPIPKKTQPSSLALSLATRHARARKSI